MKRLLATIGAAVVAAALASSLAGTAGSSTAAPTACVPGVKAVPGGTSRTFCGTARASVNVNGKTLTFTGGRCDLYPKGLVVNIGTVVLGGAKKKAYFGVLLGRNPGTGPKDPVVGKDGTYTKGLITMEAPGLKNGVNIYNWPTLKIVLKNGRRSGTFTASKPGREAFGVVVPAMSVKGSFRC